MSGSRKGVWTHWQSRIAVRLADRERVSMVLLIATVFTLSLLWAMFSHDVPDEIVYFSEISEFASAGSVTPRSMHPAVAFTGIGALFVRLLGLFGASPLLAARTLGSLCVAGCGYLAFRTAKDAFPLWPHAHLASVALVTLNPMFMFIGASANSDTMLNLCCALLFCGLAMALRHGFTVKPVVLIAVGFVLGVLTKERVWLLVPLVPVAMMSRIVIKRGSDAISAAALSSNCNTPFWSTRRLRDAAVLLSLLAVVVVFWWRAILDAVYYRSIPVDVWVFNEFVPLAVVVDWFRQRGAAWLLGTSWANFGWLQVWAPRWVYLGLYVLLIVAAVGFLIHVTFTVGRALRDRRFPSLLLRPGTHIVLLTVIALAVALYSVAQYEVALGTGSQGRYLFVVAIPAALLVLRGLFGGASQRRHFFLATVLIAVLFALNVYCLLYVAAPAYY